MKKYKLIYIAALFAGLLLCNSCDNDELLELNKNPTASLDMDLSYLFAYAQLQTSGGQYEHWRANLIYSSTMIQHLAALAGYWSGDKYTFNDGYSASLWDSNYPNAVREITWVVDNTMDDPEMVNKNAAARILRAYVMQRLTDMYGDIPYFQAGRGALNAANWRPSYDSQEDIYKDLINEVKEAVASFDPAKETFGSQDLMYGGDIGLWKKFGNSLLLRMGMRVSNVDNTLADATVDAALAGGVMTSNADIAKIVHLSGPDGINRNGIAEVFTQGNGGDDAAKLSKTFVDWLVNNDDPRLMIFSGGLGNPYNSDTWNTDPNDQNGLPNGYNATTILTYPKINDPVNFDYHASFSFVNKKLWDYEDPIYFLTYAEVELMWAEAIIKGYTTGVAADHYIAGVTAAMKHWVNYDPSLTVSDGDIATYLAAHPFVALNGEQMIGEQYWAATFLNEYESYANWRRTGYPVLTPVNYPGNQSNGQIPRRLRYPSSEAGTNPESYAEVLSRQGPDEFTTHMWWDD